MQINPKAVEVQRSNMGEGVAYGFSNVAMAAHVLSSNIYSHHRRQEAVLRELSTNALDSHIDAGKPLEPIHVHLPTHAEPYLIIEDSGIGLFGTEVEKLIGNFFMSLSAKRKKNNGFFGVGSKSPFSYSSMFTVEAFKDGQRCLYQCYKDEANYPHMTLLAEGPTDHANGVIVNVPVEIADIDTFEIEAIKLYQHTASIPVFIGKDITDKVLALRGSLNKLVKHSSKGWKYLQVSNNSSKETFSDAYNHINHNSVVIGGISYPLDFETMAAQNSYTLGDLNIKRLQGLVIELDISKTPVNLDTGREKLQYTELTCRAIERRMREIVKFVKKKLERVSTDMTDWQLMQHINDQMAGDLLMMLGLDTIQQTHFDFQDLSLRDLEIKKLYVEPKEMRLMTLRFAEPIKRSSRKSVFSEITPKSNLHVLVKTTRTLNRELLNTYMYAKGCSLLVIEGERGKPIPMEAANHLIRQLGNPPLLTEELIQVLADQARAEHKRMIDKAQAVPLLERVKKVYSSRYSISNVTEIKPADLYDVLKNATENAEPVYYFLKRSNSKWESPCAIVMEVATTLGFLPNIQNIEGFSGLIALEKKTLDVLSDFTCLVDINTVLKTIGDDPNHTLNKTMVRTMAKQMIGHSYKLGDLRIEHHIKLKAMSADLFGAQAWKFKAAERLGAIRDKCNDTRSYISEGSSFWIQNKKATIQATNRINRLKTRMNPLKTMLSDFPMLSQMHPEINKVSTGTEERKAMVRNYIAMVMMVKAQKNDINFTISKAA